MTRDHGKAPRRLRTTRSAGVEGPLVVFSWPLPTSVPADRAVLTDAEHAVVALLLAGEAYTEIARRRRVSLGTVKKQIASAYRKLGVGSRAELVARWPG